MSSPNPETAQALSLYKLAAFGTPAIAVAALTTPLSIYLPPFYSTEMGMGMTTVGAIFMGTKFWDMATDPMVGVLSDRFPTRFGRRRHWIVLSVPILLLSGFFVFFPRAVLSGPATPLFLVSALVALYVGYTFLTISHTSWGAELSPHYHERSRIQGAIQISSLIGMVLVLGTATFTEVTGATLSARQRVEAMGWFMMLALPLSTLLAVFSVSERPVAPQRRMGWWESWATVARNRPMRRLLVADLMVALPGSARASVFVFFVGDILEAPEWTSLLLLAYFLAGPLAVPAWIAISRRIGKHRALAAGVLLHVVVTLGYLLPGPGDVALFGALSFLSGIVYGGTPFLLRSITADVADLDTVESGQQRTGLYFSLITMTTKVGLALGVGIGYPLLDWIGFTPGGTNSAAALAGLRYTYVFIPVFSELLVVSLIYRFPIDEHRQRELQQAIQQTTGEPRSGSTNGGRNP
jgi:Na+/melibiose symporter-like transporter